ncbi:MAG: SAM-dependent methyltransferase [Anaeroplasmataceae bacterium]|nr:SAM-dependent methyltransferase [Anaeroplasmataceae bacterium]
MDIDFPKEIYKGILSIPSKNCLYNKCKFQIIKIKEEEIYQFSFYTKTQVFHENIVKNDINHYLNSILGKDFQSLEIFAKEYIYAYKISSKGKLLTNKRKNNEQFITLQHNKKKNYLLEDGVQVPALIDLGVMTNDGKVVKNKYEKFKQINRFIEIIEDSIKDESYLKIIDFGCGKSYLTFILYYYLTEVKKIECDIIGLDLKEDVVRKCNAIASKYQYSHLHFYNGDIAKYKEEEKVDMIVTLHACDTATDYALFHAIQMKCKYIFSVPCCQHELNMQIKMDRFHMISKFGILKERMAAILTDSIRANLLQYKGYKTQVLEFVDLEGSLKNLLIRATFENLNSSSVLLKEVEDTLNYFQIKHTLYELLKTKDCL